jgi:hypothetical protein
VTGFFIGLAVGAGVVSLVWWAMSHAVELDEFD